MSTTNSLSKEEAKGLLIAFRKCNKVAREARAKKLGFKSAEAYMVYLESYLVVQPVGTKKENKSTSVPVIHIVDLLDRSGSMGGGKITNALTGINTSVYGLKESNVNVEYTYTLCTFGETVSILDLQIPIKTVGRLNVSANGGTPMLDAIGDTIFALEVKEGDKVLVNIYTDGQENSSTKFTWNNIKASIESLSKLGWTFTFIGTRQDVQAVQSRLSIHESNTLVYDGTASGLHRSMISNSEARQTYSKGVELGEDVSIGFFKQIIKK